MCLRWVLVLYGSDQMKLFTRWSADPTSLALSQLNNSGAPMGMAVGMPEVKELPPVVEFAKNPLADTHEFRQACSICFMKHGKV